MKNICTLVAVLIVSGCGNDRGSTDPGTAYTLYRNTVVEGTPQRVHMATFDADENEDYNRENCQTAAELFQAQPGVMVRYWCEKGRYRE